MSDTSGGLFSTRASVLVAVRDPANHGAWDVFLARYVPMIRRWCRRWRRHWSPDQVDEAVHEVCIRLVFAMRTFRYRPEDGRFRGWLKTVTYRLLAEPTNPRWLVFVDDTNLSGVEAPPAPETGGIDLEFLERAKEKVRGRVEERTWSAYVETAERGRKPAEVAHELGMKVGAVYQAKHSVLSALRREIEAREDLD